MPFRALFLLFLLLSTIDLRFALNVADANVYEKAALLAAGVAFVLGRRLIVQNAFLLAGMALATLLMALMSHNPGFNWDRYARGLVSLVAPFLFLTAEPTRKDRYIVLQAVAFLPLLWLAVGIVYASAGIHPLWYEGRLQGPGIPAGMGGIGYIGVAAAMLCAGLKFRGYGVLAILNGVLLLLSGARMPIAVTALVAPVIYSFAIRRLTYMRMATMALIPIFALVGLSLVSEKLLSRVASSDLSGRDLIWAAMDHLHARFPLFGMGLGHSILSVPHAVTRDTGTIAAHNEYLRLAVECGDIGVVLIFGIIVVMCFTIWRSPRVRFSPILLAALAAFLIYSATDNTISSGIPPLVIFMASLYFAKAEAPLRRARVTDWTPAGTALPRPGIGG
jgi:hypothetical protein